MSGGVAKMRLLLCLLKNLVATRGEPVKKFEAVWLFLVFVMNPYLAMSGGLFGEGLYLLILAMIMLTLDANLKLTLFNMKYPIP